MSRVPTPPAGILPAWKRAAAQHKAIFLAPEAPGFVNMLMLTYPTLGLPSPGKLQAFASVKRTTAVCTPPKRLYKRRTSSRYQPKGRKHKMLLTTIIHGSLLLKSVASSSFTIIFLNTGILYIHLLHPAYLGFLSGSAIFECSKYYQKKKKQVPLAEENTL